MQVYVVQSSTTGVVAVAADERAALLLLRSATETHPAYNGRPVRLGRNLESLAPHEPAWFYSFADVTVEISVQTLMSSK